MKAVIGTSPCSRFLGGLAQAFVERLLVTDTWVEDGTRSRELVAPPPKPGNGKARESREHGCISTGEPATTTSVAANDMFVSPASASLKCGERGIDVPKGHTGPVLLSDTGRTVWWTGRVAIGLRYEPPRHAESFGQSALWLQGVLLECA
jgi:hypothetical protein